MATKKEGLPEINVDNGQIVEEAKGAANARAKAAEYTTVEKEHSQQVALLAEGLRQEEVGREKYIGIVRVTNSDLPPVRIEFRMENGQMPVEEESNLDALYGSSRPLLFQREMEVNKITDPTALIKELVDSGKNPWDYLDISVRKGMDHILVESKNVIVGEAILPREGLLNTLNEIKNTLSSDAKVFTKAYLEKALKPRVVLGTKGKA
jgi:hypothetical protein